MLRRALAGLALAVAAVTAGAQGFDDGKGFPPTRSPASGGGGGGGTISGMLQNSVAYGTADGGVTSEATFKYDPTNDVLSAKSFVADGGTVTVNSGAGVNLVIDETGVDRNSASDQTLTLQNSGAGRLNVTAEGTLTLDSAGATDLVISETTISRNSASDLTITLDNPGAGDLSLIVSGDLTVDTNTICTTKATNRVGFGTCSAAFTVDVVGTLGVSSTSSFSDTLTISHATGNSQVSAFDITKTAGTGAEIYARMASTENDATKFPLRFQNGSSTSGVSVHSILGFTGTYNGGSPAVDASGLVIAGYVTPNNTVTAPPLRLDCGRTTTGSGAGDGATGTLGAVSAGNCVGMANFGSVFFVGDFSGKMTQQALTTATSGTMNTFKWGAATTQGGATAVIGVDNTNLTTGDTFTSWSFTNTSPGGTKTSAGTQTWIGYTTLWRTDAIAQTTNSGTITAIGYDVDAPAMTQTTGTVTLSGFRFQTPVSGAIVTGGVMTGYEFLAPTTSGPAAGTLRGFWARNLTSAGAGTEIGVDVGTGYDVGIQSASVANLAAGVRDDDANQALDLIDAEGVRFSQTITTLKTCSASTQDGTNSAAGTVVRYIKSNVEHVCWCKQTGSGTFAWVGLSPTPDCT